MSQDPSYLQQRAMELASQRRSPGLSAILAFFFPVLGALYTHRWVMAVVFVVLDVAFAILSFFGIGLPLLFLLRIVAAIMCHSGAVQMNAMALEDAADRYASGPARVETPSPSRAALEARPSGGTVSGTPKASAVSAPPRTAAPESVSADRGVCNCCGQWFAEQTRRRPPFGRIWVGLLAEHNAAGICPACYNNYVGMQGFERDMSGDEWRPVALGAIQSARTIEELQDIFRKYNDLVPDLVEPLRVRSEEIKQETERAAARASFRPCARCGDSFPPQKLNYADQGQMCDVCYGKMIAFS